MLKSRCIFASLALPLLLSFANQVRAEDLPLDIERAKSVLIDANQCAMFIWVGYPSRLMFISIPNEDRAFSSYAGVQTHVLSYKRNSDKFGQFATQDLWDKSDRAMELRLGDPRDILDHVLYETGTMTLAASDGWISVENAQAVSSCNPSAEAIMIGLNENQSAFLLPKAFKTPTQLIEIDKTIDVAQAPSPAPPQQIPLIVETPIVLEAVASETIILDTPLPAIASTQAEIPPIVTQTISISQSDQYTVQLGAFDSASDAQAAWVRFQKDIDYLQDRHHTLQFAEIKDKGVFYRLRVTGFDDRSHADALCLRLKADGMDCFVPRLEEP